MSEPKRGDKQDHGDQYRVTGEAWILYFEDATVPQELFSGYGAEQAARSRWENAKLNWSCHLFATVEPCVGSAVPHIDAEALRLAREFVDPGAAGARNCAIAAIRRDIGPKTAAMVEEALVVAGELVRLSERVWPAARDGMARDIAKQIEDGAPGDSQASR